MKRRSQEKFRKLPNVSTERYVSNNSLRENRSQSVRMEGISSSNQNSDQTDSYFRAISESKKVSDGNNEGSNSESKEKEEKEEEKNWREQVELNNTVSKFRIKMLKEPRLNN